MGVFNDKMTALADTFRSKFSLTEPLTIDEMTTTLTDAEIGGGDGTTTVSGYLNANGQFQGVDLSGDSPVDSGEPETITDGNIYLYATGQDEPDYTIATTATAADILVGTKAVLNGVLTDGIMPVATATVNKNIVTITDGKISAQTITVPVEFDFSAATEFSANQLLDGQKGYNSNGELITGTMSNHGDVTVTLQETVQTLDGGYYNSITVPAQSGGSDFDFSPATAFTSAQLLAGQKGWDSSGNLVEGAMANKGALSVTLSDQEQTFAAGYYSGITVPAQSSGEATFYMATSYQGVLTEIRVTAGQVETWNGVLSLVGTYTIVDPSAKGAERVWLCESTTASGDESTGKVYLRAFDYEIGWDDESGESIYEPRWGFSGSNNSYTDSAYIYANATTNDTPFGVTGYTTGMDTSSMPVTPVLTSDTADTAPYGPAAWNGKKMTWTDDPIYATYGDECLPACVGYWERQDSGEITINSTWVNPVSGAILRINDRLNEYRTWGIYWTLDYYNGAMGIVYTQAGYAFIETGAIPSPFSKTFTAALGGVMPQAILYGATYSKGFAPENNETTGLPIAQNVPQLGQIYNTDATIKISAMYPLK